jgi:uncharacterized protein
MDMNTHNSQKTNRLIHEKSPYLLQHAYNPVDWYPWGDEAFQKARTEDKPIFLSIGYSTCYWCHVMEREVFENESIASLMNRTVVSIKIDREERPDIDRVYMSALQAMTGGGGWPMSLFLTPDLRPFFGATYIPPVDRQGRAGFQRVLERIHEAWNSDRSQILEASQRMNEYLLQTASKVSEPREVDAEALQSGYNYFRSAYDSANKGFGGAPKFPRPSVLNFLLRQYARTNDQPALQMTVDTLRAMARGGIHDHIGGGFHRYATDERWHVPHFEKMLYDQAQLAVSYLEAFQITRDRDFADIATTVCEYVLREMTHPDGGFFSAEDAESAPDTAAPDTKAEGAFYVWTRSEIDALLSPVEAEIVSRHFGVERAGNVTDDPHDVFRGKNILHIVATVADIAKQLDVPEEETGQRLRSGCAKLMAARKQRPRCHLDDKILTSWNGLMISALAKASQVLGDRRYLAAAERSAHFILRALIDPESKRLLHRYRDGEARFEAQLDDYAFLVQGLIDLYEASFDIDWFSWALSLTEEMIRLFYDNERAGFFDTTGLDSSLLVQTKEWYDGAEPSGNSIAIAVLLRLGQSVDVSDFRKKAADSLRIFGEALSRQPHATPQLLATVDASLSKPVQIIIAGSSSDRRTQVLLDTIHARFIPNKSLLFADGGKGQEYLSARVPFYRGLRMADGAPRAYVCENYSCRLPTDNPATLATLLDPLTTSQE